MRQVARRILSLENSSAVSAQWRPGVSLWNIKINKVTTHGIYFSRSRRPPESHVTLNGRGISVVYSVKYLGVIVDKKVTWRLHK
jgi:hypothetical protein